jgi:hypothetical protein
VAQTALDLYRAAGRAERVQGFFLRAGKGRPEANEEVPPAWTDRPHFEVTDPIAHKLLLSKRTSGFLALPGDLRTLEGVFSVLCEIQTGKLEKRPVVLVGSDFWGPLMEACAKAVMLSLDAQDDRARTTSTSTASSTPPRTRSRRSRASETDSDRGARSRSGADRRPEVAPVPGYDPTRPGRLDLRQVTACPGGRPPRRSRRS